MEGHLHTSLRITVYLYPLLHLRSPFDYPPTTCISLRFIICNKVSIYIVTRWAERSYSGAWKKQKKKKKIKWKNLFLILRLLPKILIKIYDNYRSEMNELKNINIRKKRKKEEQNLTDTKKRYRSTNSIERNSNFNFVQNPLRIVLYKGNFHRNSIAMKFWHE